ncbi:5-formyltetrahydrofolate cyclo-ligase [Gammaproteobacteria bacterium 45_16_T64]|nr:5-formyltetrahydrofolate cyclo-ligase [Gammaproteobacteria bacterium 45_16_T64]
MTDKHTLRTSLRQARNTLSEQQQLAASVGLCRQLLLHPHFINSQRLAVYIANDGEINLQPLIHLAWSLNKGVYLPVLHPFRQGELVFMRYEKGQPLANNRFGIPEPVSAYDTRIPAWTLDLVLTPLVGFDASGNRIGMGGGFYDRTFEFIQHNTRPRSPYMLGIAHECQKTEGLITESWDIPMNGIITDSRRYD